MSVSWVSCPVLLSPILGKRPIHGVVSSVLLPHPNTNPIHPIYVLSCLLWLSSKLHVPNPMLVSAVLLI